MNNRRTALYRHYENEVLLYIGQSYDQINRFLGHKRHTEWAHEVTRTDTEYFDSKDLAVHAESIAIKSEKPLFNIMHNKPKKEKIKSQPFNVMVFENMLGQIILLTTGNPPEVISKEELNHFYANAEQICIYEKAK